MYGKKAACVTFADRRYCKRPAPLGIVAEGGLVRGRQTSVCATLRAGERTASVPLFGRIFSGGRGAKSGANLVMVPVEGIEPPLLAEHDFESCASTSSATRASSANRQTESNRRPVILVEHDLFGKPATTFPDRARVEHDQFEKSDTTIPDRALAEPRPFENQISPRITSGPAFPDRARPVSISPGRRRGKRKSNYRGRAGRARVPGLHPPPGSAKCRGRAGRGGVFSTGVTR